MNVAHLPLLTRTIDFRTRQFRLLKDKHLYDTESIATTDTSKDFFLSTSGKKKSQALFQGDKSLVKEANLFLPVALQALVRSRRLTPAEWIAFNEKGYFVFAITVPEDVTVDEDAISAIALGPDKERATTAAAIDEAVAFDRSYQGRRTYLVGENKVVPGGRAIAFTTNWAESGGNGLLSAADLKIVFAGGEYEPKRG